MKGANTTQEKQENKQPTEYKKTQPTQEKHSTKKKKNPL
jgi:hypothetical protein